MKVRYTYVGETAVEVVVDDDGIQVNLLPPEPVAPLAEEAAAAGPPLAASPGDPVVAAPPRSRGFAAVLRFIYTSLACLLGMIGAGAKYLLDHLNDLSDINWTVVIIAVVGSLLAGLLYGLKKYFRPDPNSIF